MTEYFINSTQTHLFCNNPDSHKMTNPIIDFYEGYFRNGKQEGKGRVIKADGEIYQGNWEKGLPHGYGKLLDTKGVVYQGQWKIGKPHGQGLEM